MHTTLAAIYLKVSSPASVEAEVAELMKRLENDGCTLAMQDAVVDASEGFDGLERLVKWAGRREFDVVYIHREITLEQKDTYLEFVRQLYMQDVSVLLCG